MSEWRSCRVSTGCCYELTEQTNSQHYEVARPGSVWHASTRRVQRPLLRRDVLLW